MKFATAVAALALGTTSTESTQADDVTEHEWELPIFHPRQRSGNDKEFTQRQPKRHSTLQRRLRNELKINEDATKPSRISRNGNTRNGKEMNFDPIDLGILDGTKQNSKRELHESDDPSERREPIFDQSSIRDPPRVNSSNVPMSTNDQGQTNDDFEPSTMVPSALASEGTIQGNDFLVPSLPLLCREGVCDCESFDFESTEGIIECTTENIQPSGYCANTINYCLEDITVCYRETISLEAFGSDNYTYTTCTTYTEPYLQHVCITFDAYPEELNVTHDNDGAEWDDYIAENRFDGGWWTEQETMEYSASPCSVTFNNQECNSCRTQIRTFQEIMVNSNSSSKEILSTYQNRCFQVDCSNVMRGHIVNTCDNEVTTIRETVVFGDDCTKCPPCGIGFHMVDRDAYGTFPVVGYYQCSGLELGGFVGFFDRGVCPELQTATKKHCKCEPDFFDPELILTKSSAEKQPESKSWLEEKKYRSDAGDEKEGGAMILLPGDTIGAAPCHLCGSNDARVANPNILISLPNGSTTSCSALEGAGRLGMLTPEYCQKYAMPLVFHSCGGCYQGDDDTYFSFRSTGETTNADDAEIEQRMYREPPEEINVGDDSNGKYGSSPPPVMFSAVESQVSSGALGKQENVLGIFVGLIVLPAIAIFYFQ